MNKNLIKYISTLVLAGLITTTVPLSCAPTHTSMMGSVMRNGSALAVNLAGMLCTGLKHTLYAGLGLTSVLSYSAKKITDSNVALGVLGTAGTYYGFYTWYLQDYFAIAKEYKPIFEIDPIKQSDSKKARLIRFVNEYYDNTKAEDIMKIAAELLGIASQDLFESLNSLYKDIFDDLSKVRPHAATVVKEKVSQELYNNGVYNLHKDQEKEQEDAIVAYLGNAWAEPLGTAGPYMFCGVFPHYYQLNMLYWRLSTTQAHIMKMRGTLYEERNIKVNYHIIV